ncbi:hypothetical protein P4H66_19350 [Paenibacillus dokdonensis]|uniref:Uncharacterized protein n=1 Tax=Paenibacillus dokdonensis TaxID=2567944 RepID=A0ABU6GS81_9BACL|nr:hypothetical protein [Paenibacillus dokdonensis]MEC0241962.1 hypothetical protein [Paenibacillus dokdonensis]
MKEIIYLNTEFLHSFMAQQFEGLPISTTKENSQQDTTTSNDGTQKKSFHEIEGEIKSGDIGIPGIFSTPSGRARYKYGIDSQFSETLTLAQVEAGKEIISKQLHDNALDEFEKYLVGNSSLHEVDFDSEQGEDYIGKYIKLKSTFMLFDLNYVKNLTNSTLLKKFFKIPGIASPNQFKNGKLSPQLESGFLMMDTLLEYLESILPTNLFLKQGNFVSPLKSDYLRESSSELNFKYGEDSELKVCVIGRVTKVFDSFDAGLFKEGGNFNDMSVAINEMIHILLNQINTIESGDIIISPVAIYFE